MLKRIKPLIYSLITIVITIAIVYFIQVATESKIAGDKTVDNSSKEQVSTSQGNFKIYGSREEAITALNKLTISDADDSDYSGDVRNNLYGGWKSARKSTTRIEVLKDQSENFTVNDKNKITGGTWYIPYTGETVTYQSKEEVSKNIQIDHIVPVAYAHRHGASSWDEDKREEFYNDYGQSSIWSNGDNSDDYENVGNLIVSDSRSNIQKSDSGPSEWLPSNKDYILEYCERWVKICNAYDISITQDDYNTIKGIFENA